MIWNLRRPIAVAATWALLGGQIASAQTQDRTLTLTVLKGQDGINDVAKKMPTELAIMVTSGTAPVANAKVTIIFPAQGPSLRTSDSKPSAVANTDVKGLAAFTGLMPNELPGEIDILALANADGRVAQIHVRQTNVTPVSSNSGTGAAQPAPAVMPASEAAAKPQAAMPTPPTPKAGKSHGHTALWIVIGVMVAGGIVGAVAASSKSKQ